MDRGFGWMLGAGTSTVCMTARSQFFDSFVVMWTGLRGYYDYVYESG